MPPRQRALQERQPGYPGRALGVDATPKSGPATRGEQPQSRRVDGQLVRLWLALHLGEVSRNAARNEGRTGRMLATLNDDQHAMPLGLDAGVIAAAVMQPGCLRGTAGSVPDSRRQKAIVRGVESAPVTPEPHFTRVARSRATCLLRPIIPSAPGRGGRRTNDEAVRLREADDNAADESELLRMSGFSNDGRAEATTS
jgi:hypothetical protein